MQSDTGAIKWLGFLVEVMEDLQFGLLFLFSSLINWYGLLIPFPISSCDDLFIPSTIFASNRCALRLYRCNLLMLSATVDPIF